MNPKKNRILLVGIWLAGHLTTIAFEAPLFAKDEKVPISEVPPLVLGAALRVVPDLVVAEVERESGEGDTWHYELEGLANGTEVEVEVTPDGEVIDIERDDSQVRKAKTKNRKRTGWNRRPYEAAVGGRDPSSSISGSVDLTHLSTNESECVAVAKLGDLVRAWILTRLRSLDSVARGGKKPWHAVLKAENYHALQFVPRFRHRPERSLAPDKRRP